MEEVLDVQSFQSEKKNPHEVSPLITSTIDGQTNEEQYENMVFHFSDRIEDFKIKHADDQIVIQSLLKYKNDSERQEKLIANLKEIIQECKGHEIIFLKSTLGQRYKENLALKLENENLKKQLSISEKLVSKVVSGSL